MHEGRAQVFFAMGGNFLSAAPDTEYTAEALRRCRLTVHVSTKLNRAHLVTGRAGADPAVPRPHRARRPGRRPAVRHGRGLDGRGARRREAAWRRPRSTCSASRRSSRDSPRPTLGPDSSVDWEALAADYDRIRDQIAEVVPGFEDYNARVREPGGFYLPNAAARAAVRDRDRQGAVHRPCRSRASSWPRASC